LSASEKNLTLLLEHFILDLPKDILSGDFYWVCKTERRFVIAVMDCTGHGVPGALMSILGITLLNEIVINDHVIQPHKILESLRLKIINALSQKKGFGHIKDGIEGSVICFDIESKKLLYSGSFNPLILIHNDDIIVIKANRFPVGYHEVNGNFTLHEIYIEKNDIIYLFSDGIIDQFGGTTSKRFMLKHLKEILLGNHNDTMVRQKEILKEELNRWKGDSIQTDDILVLGIRF
jgi:serine phosphatase RsbU (regulator of sigma subunit)